MWWGFYLLFCFFLFVTIALCIPMWTNLMSQNMVCVIFYCAIKDDFHLSLSLVSHFFILWVIVNVNPLLSFLNFVLTFSGSLTVATLTLDCGGSSAVVLKRDGAGIETDEVRTDTHNQWIYEYASLRWRKCFRMLLWCLLSQIQPKQVLVMESTHGYAVWLTRRLLLSAETVMLGSHAVWEDSSTIKTLNVTFRRLLQEHAVKTRKHNSGPTQQHQYIHLLKNVHSCSGIKSIVS